MNNLSKSNKILMGIFAAQILITGAIYIGSHSPSANATQSALLAADQTQIDKIIIEKDKEKTIISKVDGKWQLPDYHQLPASANKVKTALDKLAQTQSGWPIATTESSHERFEVGDDKFKTRITLAKGDDVVEKLYLGTSPGFRQIHVRKEGGDEVYSVKLNDFDYPASKDSWLDRSLLRAGDNIAALSGPDFHLQKQGDQWKVADESDAKLEVVKDEADQLVAALGKLNVNKAVDKKLENPNYQLKVKAPNKEYEYRFYKDGSSHYVTRNDHKLAFEINSFDYEKIAGKTQTQLVKQIDEEKPETVAGNGQDNKEDENS